MSDKYEVTTACATCTNADEGVLVDGTYMMVKCKVYDLFIPIAVECKDYKPESDPDES